MSATLLMNVNPAHRPVVAVPNISSESTALLTELMNENHQKHHAFFRTTGFHNHISHHLLAAYALGATPDELRHHYSYNAQYQRPPPQSHKDVQDSILKEPKAFLDAMSQQESYVDFLELFSAQIAKNGVKWTVDEYLFADTEVAKAMYGRVYASILHPLIHIGLAVEYNLPAMAAEALAWTAVHKDEAGGYIRGCQAKAASTTATGAKLPSVLSLFEEARSPAIRAGIEHKNFLKNMILETASLDAVEDVAAKYVVPESQVRERMYEAINAVAYLALGVQKPPYKPKVDFFIIHMLNASVFLPALLLDFLEPPKAARVLEDFVRSVIFTYACEASPDFHYDYALTFATDPARRAAHYSGTEYPTWESLYARGNALDDDGHILKAVRALKGAEMVAGKQTLWPEPCKKEDFLGLAGVLMRGCETELDFVKKRGPSDMWVRGSGFTESWKGFQQLEN